jgi:hypothetical protein
MATDDSTRPGRSPDTDGAHRGDAAHDSGKGGAPPVTVRRLTNADTGHWQVTTQASTYLIDLDTRRAVRLPGHRPPPADGTQVVTVIGNDGLTYEVTQLLGDGDWERLLLLIHCVVGESMYLYTLPEEHVLTTRGSTPVREIRAIPGPASTASEGHDDEP